MLSQGYRSLKFADDIRYKFKSSQASKARFQSSKHTGAKQNLTQNGDSRSLKVTPSLGMNPFEFLEELHVALLSLFVVEYFVILARA